MYVCNLRPFINQPIDYVPAHMTVLATANNYVGNEAE